MQFYEIYKMLIASDTHYKENLPHLLTTGIGFCTQENYAAVEFDYKTVYEREDRYSDVVGFYHTHPPGLNSMSQTDVDTMEQWAKCLGKSLICLIETDTQINGWRFYKDEAGKILYHEIKAESINDINYDVWVNPISTFWSPTDFILNTPECQQEQEDDEFDKLETAVFNIEKKVISLEQKIDQIHHHLRDD
jgi:proteasome lid subunit RPN8/RPN11